MPAEPARARRVEQPLPAMPVARARVRPVRGKRVFDVAVSIVALVAGLPLMALIAVLIKLDDRGPVFYRQVRIGLNGKAFTIWKFRTMIRGADRIAPNVSPTSDPRVTRIGKLLRASYLDELPQLFNVINGTMSLVGPRPETPEFLAWCSPDELGILEVRPGLIGPSTLASMDEAAVLEATDDPLEYYIDVLMHERIQLDLTYLETMSVPTDIRLLARQARAILFGHRS